MIIAIDCRLIDYIQNTGISRYTEFLIEYYKSRVGEKNIILISNDPDLKIQNIKMVYTKLKPFSFLSFLQFGSFVKKLNIEVFHSPFYSSFFYKPAGIISLLTVHDLMFRLVPRFFGDSLVVNFLKKYYFNSIVCKSLKNSDYIISVSNTTKFDLKMVYGFDSTHIPEDSHIVCSSDRNIFNKHSLKEQQYFLYCGNRRPHKNISFLRDVFEKNSSLPLLVLAGKGHESGTNVLATGIVSDEELQSLYKGAIAFVFPSQYEGFGLPILEAIRNGTKVVASAIPAFLEFESKNIYFFDLNDDDSLKASLKVAQNSLFYNDEDFLSTYSKENIYKLNDILISSFNLISNNKHE